MSTLQNADVNHHNVHICSTENPYATIQHQLELPKLSVLCTTPWEDVYSPSFFLKNSQYSSFIWKWLSPQPDKDLHSNVF